MKIQGVSIGLMPNGSIEINATVDGTKVSMLVIESRNVNFSTYSKVNYWDVSYAYTTSYGDVQTSVWSSIDSTNPITKHLFQFAKDFCDANAGDPPAPTAEQLAPEEEATA